MSVLVSGRVQGVWFRGWTQDQARALDLRGWVRNLPDGRVEALVAGPGDRVARLIEMLHEGPPAARVDDVDCRDVDGYDGEGFEISR